MKMVGAVAFLLWTSTMVWSQIKVATITDETGPSSKAVMAALRSKIAEHPKQFALVDSKDSELPGSAGKVGEVESKTQVTLRKR
jgi:hypothetical protein